MKLILAPCVSIRELIDGVQSDAVIPNNLQRGMHWEKA